MLVFISCSLLGQYASPAPGIVFDDHEVPRVDITIVPILLQQILDNPESNEEYPATFIFTHSMVTDTIEEVGFRLRGNTSRSADKKSFKISFNSYVSGKKYRGLEKMNLNGEHNDPSIMRSKLCWDTYQQADIPVSRSNHVAFYINGEYHGLYINIEHIDEEFIQKRFSDDGGNLYKCLWPADLHYRGADPQLYAEPEDWGRQAYELKTNLDEYDYSGIAHFIDVLNNYEGDEFVCELERIFDVDNYLKVIAMDVLVSNWDGPIVNKNNFYLYHNPKTERITYIPYDLDNTLGIDWFGINWVETDIYKWSELSNDYRPIYENILGIPEYERRYTYYMSQILDQVFSPEILYPYLDDRLELVKTFRVNDVFAEMDYGYTYSDFLQSYETQLGAHVKYGLKPYITARTNSAIDQIDLNDILPFVRHIDPIVSENQVQFNFDFVDDHPIATGNIHFQIDNGAWQNEAIQVDANNLASHIIEHDQTAELNYWIELIDDIGQSSRYPRCENATLKIGFDPTPQLVINEFMASNDQTVLDEYEESDDWIELFNSGDETINLSGLFLSDDKEQPRKWAFPDVELEPSSYLIVWADSKPSQGALHTNFKLAKSGEFIGLFDTDENNNAPIDVIDFGEQQTDVSYARHPNGSGAFEHTANPTFGFNNDESTSVGTQIKPQVSIFPSPAYESVCLLDSKNNDFNFELYSTKGQLLKTGVLQTCFSLEGIPSGLYILVLSSKTFKQTFKLIIQ